MVEIAIGKFGDVIRSIDLETLILICMHVLFDRFGDYNFISIDLMISVVKMKKIIVYR